MTTSSRTPSTDTCPPLRSAGRRSCRVRFVLLLVVFAGLHAGCAGRPPTPVAPGASSSLAADEGFLVVHVDAELVVEKLDAGLLPIARDLPVGDHLWIIRAKAGRYRWSGIRLLAQDHGSATIRPKREDESALDEFAFDIEAGKINYPGHLLVRLRAPALGIRSGLSIRSRNHAAMAIRRLSKSHPELIESRPIRNAGTSGDRFLDFYSRERDRLRAEPPPRRAPQEAAR